MKYLLPPGRALGAALVLGALVAPCAYAKATEHGVLKLALQSREAKLVTTQGNIRFNNSHGAMEITSATAGTAKLVYEGAEIESSHLKCKSSGKATGVVETSLLSAELGWISRSKVEVGVGFKPAAGTYLLEMECEGVTARVKGSAIAQVSPVDVSALELKLNFRKGAIFANSPESFEGGAPAILTSEFNGTPAATALEQMDISARNHGVCKSKNGVERCKSSPLEVNTIVNPARPEFGRCVKGGSKQFTDANCTVKAEGKTKGKYGFNPAPS